MIFITENADIKLQKVLYEARDKKETIKCIRLNKNLASDLNIKQLVQIIDHTLQDPDGMIFRCEENEIFITAHGLTTKGVDRLNSVLKEIVPPKSPVPAEGLAILLDPQIEWRDIMDHVDRKVLLLEKRLVEEKKKQERLMQEAKRQQIMGISFEPELMALMEKKRTMRERINILVVEDDDFTRSLISNTLKAGHDVYSAPDGMQAVSKYPSLAPDIVFLDIELPDISGLDVLQKILSLDRHAFVVMLSGNSQRDNILKAIDMGAKGFIGKPFTKEKLFQYIQKSPRYKIISAGVNA